ncbi:MAG: ABC transporter ATP-binding protein [Clostridiales bacterium]|nr:ABC transporter ATP-binding protein [Clostridiales bacterium]
MNTLLQYLKPHTGIMTWTFTVKLFAAMMDLLIPSILARIIDKIVPLGEPRQIYLWGGLMVLCALLAIATNIYANRMAALTSGKVTRAVRHDLFAKISSLSMAQIDGISLSSAVSRLTTDTYNINQFLNRMQRMGVRAPILLIGGLVMTLTLDFRLTLVLVLTLPFISLIVYQVTRRTVPLYTKQQTVLDRLVRVMQENITGIRIIKALSKTEYEQQRFDGVNGTLANTTQRAGRVAALSNPLTSLTLNLGLTLVVLAGGFLVNRGMSTPGTIIAFLNYFMIILQAMMGITRIFIMSSRGVASAGRVAEVLNMPQDLAVIAGPPQAETEDHLVFDRVSFSYNKVENNLEGISFRLKRGETLGILGATGSGKTTLVNLLLRLYDPDSGRVLLGGRDMRTLPPEDLHGKVGVVFQNDFLMADTIRENIRYYRDIPDERVWQAAEDAQAAQFIRDTEQGLDHMVAQKGNNLSGGQKQRLLIARALAGDPELLILDDASSALDYRTDASLRRALHRRYGDTTSIIIAQRVSSIKGADRILVLEEGREIGYGTHDELMEGCPTYREIALTQMGAEGGARDV